MEKEKQVVRKNDNIDLVLAKMNAITDIKQMQLVMVGKSDKLDKLSLEDLLILKTETNVKWLKYKNKETKEEIKNEKEEVDPLKTFWDEV